MTFGCWVIIAKVQAHKHNGKVLKTWAVAFCHNNWSKGYQATRPSENDMS